MTQRLGVDIGGTFTDVVCLDELTGNLVSTKVLTSEGDPSAGVMDGIGRLMPSMDGVRHFVHGTTVGLNALLERRGARAALLTTRGFRDVYEIARANRTEIYNLFYRKPKPLIPRTDIFEVDERTMADGTIRVALSESGLAEVVAQIREAGYDALAIAFLHSYKNPTNEGIARDIVQRELPNIPIVLSSEICPEWREYERTSTVALSAYVAPAIQNYVGRLLGMTMEAGFLSSMHVMQSNGGIIPAAEAVKNPIQTLFSGPVGGLVGAAALGQSVGATSLMAIDMGGTSFDVGLVLAGEFDTVQEVTVAGLPLLMSSVNINTVGAGGGSIAWADGRSLRVGPQSAGAVPGPVCYGKGGRNPTVTDANLLLGRIDAHHFLGGSMRLDVEAAEIALAALGNELRLDRDRLAEGILEVVNVKMANAIRAVTIQKGVDPRDFDYMVAYGGAGPLHGAILAQELGVRSVIFPNSPGNFSAWGMLQADIRRDAAVSYFHALEDVDPEAVGAHFEGMLVDLTATLRHEDPSGMKLRYLNFADVRYRGQEYFLTIPMPETDRMSDALKRLAENFHKLYSFRFSHQNVDHPIEIVNLRASVWSTVERKDPAPIEVGDTEMPRPDSTRNVRLDGKWMDTSIYYRKDLRANHRIAGPAIVEEPSCTILIPPFADARVDLTGNIILEIS